MSKNRFFIMYNEPFMAVLPVQSLMTSNTIADAVRKGNIFGVNMNTGGLTIISKKKLNNAGYEMTEDGYVQSVTRKPVEDVSADTKIYVKHLRLGGVELPNTSYSALLTLRTILVNNTLTDIFDKKMLYVYSNKNVTPVNFTEHDSWNSYSEKIRSFYSKHGLS